MVLILLALLGAVALWLWRHRWNQRHSPDPKTWPFLGAYLEFKRNFHRLHDWTYGYFSDETRTWKLVLPSVTVHFTVDPLVVEHTLKSNFYNYPKGKRQHNTMYDFLGDGIFNTDGETWKKHRNHQVPINI